MLDRDVAFALIKTEGLDNVGRERVSREAQAMAGSAPIRTSSPSTTAAKNPFLLSLSVSERPG